MELSIRQKQAAKKSFRLNGCPIYWRVGTGKTRVAIATFAMIAKSLSSNVSQFLVVCRREAFFDWENEFKKCGLPKWKIKIVEEESDLYIQSPSVPSSDRVEMPRVFLISHGKLARLESVLCDYGTMIQMVCYDELFLYKNPQSLHCKAANNLSQQVGRAMGLSGSIMTARNLTDIFGGLYAINKHQPLGNCLTTFRSRYMHKFAIRPNAGDGAARWVNSKRAGEKISELIRPIVSIYFPNNSDRRIRESSIKIPASRMQEKAFDELREFCSITYKGQPIDLKNAPSVIIKCQQISDGFVKVVIPLKEGDLDHRFLYFPTQKEEWLVGKVAELLLCEEKVVVWCAFKLTVERLLQRLQRDLRSSKVGIYGMHGGRKFDVDGWRRNGRVAVATEASGSSINHFKDCAYAIYYSMDFHWLHLQQSQGRTNRKDSEHKICYYYFTEVEGSMDRFVRRTAQASGRTERELIAQATIKEVNSWLAGKQ